MSEFDDDLEKLMVDWPDNTTKRNQDCYRNYKDLTLHLINEGFKAFEAKKRRQSRSHYKNEVIKPEFMNENYVPPKTLVNVVVSAQTMNRAISHATDMFVGWKIGRLEIGKATKEILLKEATNERNRGAGHLVNAVIYEKLARPMNSKQTVAQYWKTKKAVQLIREDVVNNIENYKNGIIEGEARVEV